MLCSIVIPNYNGIEFLKRCIPSLFAAIAHDRGQHEVIVVDNGSQDESVSYLEGFGAPLRVLPLESNLGFARACNIGAAESQGDILLFLNNDMYFDQAFLGPLCQHFAGRDDLFAVSAGLWDWNGRFQAGRTYARFVLGSFEVGFDRQLYEEACYTLYTSGAASAVDRRKFERIGAFDEMLYIYEDVDLGYRAWKQGWKVLHEPRSIVYHKGRATSKRVYSKHKYYTINLKNRFWFIWKNISDQSLTNRYLALLPASLLYLSVRLRSPAPFFAFWNALQKRQEIVSKRQEAAKSAVRSDHEVLRFLQENKPAGSNR